MHTPDVNAGAAGPFAGIVMIASGAAFWCWSTIVKMVGGGPVAAMSSPPLVAGLAWADVGQWASGATVVAGVLVGAVLSNRAKIAQARRERDDEDAAARRARDDADAESRRFRDHKDAMDRIDIMMAQRMAELRIQQAEIAAGITGHLARQDEQLAALTAAVQAPAEPAAPAPPPAAVAAK